MGNDILVGSRTINNHIHNLRAGVTQDNLIPLVPKGEAKPIPASVSDHIRHGKIVTSGIDQELEVWLAETGNSLEILGLLGNHDDPVSRQHCPAREAVSPRSVLLPDGVAQIPGGDIYGLIGGIVELNPLAVARTLRSGAIHHLAYHDIVSRWRRRGVIRHHQRQEYRVRQIPVYLKHGRQIIVDLVRLDL